MLAEYDIVYMTRKAMKGSVIAIIAFSRLLHLADNAIEDYKPLNFDFPYEDVLVVEKEEELDWWTMYFDKAINVYDNRARAMIILPNRKQYPVSIKL